MHGEYGKSLEHMIERSPMDDKPDDNNKNTTNATTDNDDDDLMTMTTTTITTDSDNDTIMFSMPATAAYVHDGILTTVTSREPSSSRRRR